jgi:AcrR family transcriptional regulator
MTDWSWFDKGDEEGRVDYMAQAPRVPSPRRLPPDRPGPMGGRRDQNRRERTQAILDAGLSLFLEHGLDAVTIDDITKRAGIAKGGFYRYFDDKAELVKAIIEPTASEFRTAMRRCALALGKAEGAAELTAAYLELAASVTSTAFRNKEAVRLYLQEHRAPTIGAREAMRRLALELERGAVHLSQAAVEHGLIVVADPRISALAVIGAVEQLALVVFRGDLDAPPDQIARVVVSMVLEGIRAR